MLAATFPDAILADFNVTMFNTDVITGDQARARKEAEGAARTQRSVRFARRIQGATLRGSRIRSKGDGRVAKRKKGRKKKNGEEEVDR